MCIRTGGKNRSNLGLRGVKARLVHCRYSGTLKYVFSNGFKSLIIGETILQSTHEVCEHMLYFRVTQLQSNTAEVLYC